MLRICKLTNRNKSNYVNDHTSLHVCLRSASNPKLCNMLCVLRLCCCCSWFVTRALYFCLNGKLRRFTVASIMHTHTASASNINISHTYSYTHFQDQILGLKSWALYSTTSVTATIVIQWIAFKVVITLHFSALCVFEDDKYIVKPNIGTYR